MHQRCICATNQCIKVISMHQGIHQCINVVSVQPINVSKLYLNICSTSSFMSRDGWVINFSIKGKCVRGFLVIPNISCLIWNELHLHHKKVPHHVIVANISSFLSSLEMSTASPRSPKRASSTKLWGKGLNNMLKTAFLTLWQHVAWGVQWYPPARQFLWGSSERGGLPLHTRQPGLQIRSTFCPGSLQIWTAHSLLGVADFGIWSKNVGFIKMRLVWFVTELQNVTDMADISV